jgi:hypothetical protein
MKEHKDTKESTRKRIGEMLKSEHYLCICATEEPIKETAQGVETKAGVCSSSSEDAGSDYTIAMAMHILERAEKIVAQTFLKSVATGKLAVSKEHAGRAAEIAGRHLPACFGDFVTRQHNGKGVSFGEFAARKPEDRK